MKQGLQLKFSQNLSLTPQLQQAIRLLQLSSLELNQEIDLLMQTNPLLERADEAGDFDGDDDLDGLATDQGNLPENVEGADYNKNTTENIADNTSESNFESEDNYAYGV